MKIKLPEKTFYTPWQLAEKWEVTEQDILHLVETGALAHADKFAALRGHRSTFFVAYSYDPTGMHPASVPNPTREDIASVPDGDHAIVAVPIPIVPPAQPYGPEFNLLRDFSIAEAMEGQSDASELVILTSDVSDFEARYAEKERGEDVESKPLRTTERRTLLVIIAALCDFSVIKYEERGASALIAKMTEEIGAAVTDDTVLKVLRQIPEAVDARQK